MNKEVNVNQIMSADSMRHPMAGKESTTMKPNLSSALNQTFDLIFNSSKQVLGNISSIGIKYGNTLENPDHLLVVFPDEVHGFESWHSTTKNKWRYQRHQKTVSKNGVHATESDQQSFVMFVQQGLMAMNEQNVSFSKNITQKELQTL